MSRLSKVLLPMFSAIVLLVVGCSSTTERPAANNANVAPPVNAASPAASVASPNTAPKAKLNINTASDSELLSTIPNLGNRMLHEFEEYRPYHSIQQFRREIGKYVQPEQVAEYEKYIFVPIDPNQADAVTLQQIPGVDAPEAEALIAGRPYATSQAFLDKLVDKVSAPDLEVAKTYLSQK